MGSFAAGRYSYDGTFRVVTQKPSPLLRTIEEEGIVVWQPFRHDEFFVSYIV